MNKVRTSSGRPLVAILTGSKVYGFEGETKKKYSDLTYKLFEEVFTARKLFAHCSTWHSAHDLDL